MNYSDYERKNLQQIIKEADKRGIVSRSIHPSEVSRDDLIGMIIAHDAYYEGKNDVIRKLSESRTTKTEEPREKYLLHDGSNNEDYYLELTKAQVNFFAYLEEENICPRDATLEPINDITFEAP